MIRKLTIVLALAPAVFIVLMEQAIILGMRASDAITEPMMSRFLDKGSFLPNNGSSSDPLKAFEEIMARRDDSVTQCSGNLHFVPDKRLESSGQNKKLSRIPRIVHQTSRDRCLAESLHNTTHKWRDFENWEYLFYDDKTINDVFKLDFPEFPHLHLVTENCLLSGTARADLFRYLILYVVGGMYADIDSAPRLLNASAISETDEGFSVVEQYHMLSQYFMAVSPRHPLMHYAIQHCLLNLLQRKDTRKQNAAFVIGPHALHAALP